MSYQQEQSTNVEWYDPTVGAWLDLGESRSNKRAKERIAGLVASDTQNAPDNVQRYRIVTTIVDTYCP